LEKIEQTAEGEVFRGRRRDRCCIGDNGDCGTWTLTVSVSALDEDGLGAEWLWWSE
jgi:hypothetical protein